MPITYTCAHCSRAFAAKVRGDHRPRRYCGAVCYHAAQRGKPHPMPFRLGLVPCPVCATPFRPRVFGTGGVRRAYCSRKCADAASTKRRREMSSNWKGGRVSNGRGYIQLRIGKAYISEHRQVMALHLGRALLPTEIVHHKNGVKDDNRIENLELTNRSDHRRMHKATRGRWTIRYDACRGCGRTDKRHNGQGYCTTCYARQMKGAVRHELTDSDRPL